MKKTCPIVVILSLGILALGLTEGSFAQRRPSGRNRPSRRRVLIGFRDGTGHRAAERRRRCVREYGGEARHSYRFVPAAAANLSETQISRLRADPRVAYIEEDGIVNALGPELDNSWGVKHIGAGNVHPSNKGTGIKVAIIDTGIDYTHPDLDDNYKGGYDFRNNDDNPMDDHGHGTHCAGTVAAEDNGEGVVGVAPEASLYGVKVLSSSGSGYLSDVVAGIQWAAENGMDIISMSLGTDYNYQTLQNACDQADAAGVLLVAAAGNDYSIRRGSERDTVDYPARYDSVIAVGATGNTDTKASFSSTGLALELAAPGVDIKSTYRGGGYAFGSGTSMACPHVAGTAALVLASPNSNVRAILQDTADDLGDSGWDKWYGYGLVDAYEAAGAPVAGPPAADFVGGPPSGDEPLTVQFMDLSTGDITTRSWDFGDGGSSTEQDPSHEYQSAGSYTVSLTVTGPSGPDTETKVNYITVSTPAPPVAAFSGSLTSGEAPLAVQFTDESTGSITNWSWDFGDLETSAEQNPSHTYETAGDYTVSLTVTGPGSSDDEVKVNYITVTPPAAPVAAFAGVPTSGDAPLTVEFSDQSTGSITNWSWTFGDGGSSTEQNPSHTYENTGDYTVSLTVTGPGGPDDEVKVNYITVTTPPLPPVANFTADPTSGDAPLAVQFTDQSTGSISSWLWDFGDGDSSTEQHPSHTYESGGDYTVGLTVTGPGGSDTATGTDYISVTAPAQMEVEVFFDSFESSGDWTANWSQDSQSDWRRRTTRRIEGNYAAEVDGRASDAQLISIPIDLQGKQNATITFWWYIESGLDTGEYLAFDVSADGGAWQAAASLIGNVDPENTWHYVSIPVTAINDIMIRFRGTMSRSSEDAYVDVVRVIAW